MKPLSSRKTGYHNERHGPSGFSPPKFKIQFLKYLGLLALGFGTPLMFFILMVFHAFMAAGSTIDGDLIMDRRTLWNPLNVMWKPNLLTPEGMMHRKKGIDYLIALLVYIFFIIILDILIKNVKFR